MTMQKYTKTKILKDKQPLEYNKIYDLFTNYIVHTDKRLVLKTIYKIKNPTLAQRYEKTKSKLLKDLEEEDSINEMLLFHGTNAAEAICENGFKLPPKEKPNMFGQGKKF